MEGQIINNIQQGYVHNVISQEMSEGSSLASYTAQAIAARTYAYFQTNGGTVTIDNSSAKQVYIPYRFEKLGDGLGATIKANRQDVVNKAVTLPGALYVTLPNSTAPLSARFGADNCAWTEQGYVDAGQTQPLSYLKSIYDPISTKPEDTDPNATCDNKLPSPHQGTPLGGLGTAGASRWGYGNTGEFNNGTAWSVKWGDYPTNLSWQEGLQIVTHYYTGIVVRNASGTIVTPSNRWNPLEVDWGGGAFTPPEMVAGGTYPVEIRLQNTGTVAWGSSFRLACRWRKPNNSEVNCSNLNAVNPDTLNPGASNTVTLSITPPADFTPGSYTLMIDMKVGTQFFHDWEAGRPWFTLDYTVTIGEPGERLIYLPLTLRAEEGPPPPPPDLAPDCTASQHVNLTNGGFGARHTGWNVIIPANKDFDAEDLHSYDYKDPTDSFGVTRLGGVDGNHIPPGENGDAIDMHIQQQFDVPSVNSGETIWLDVRYSYCIDTSEPGGEPDEFWAEVRTFDAATVVGPPVRYTNRNRTDPEHEDCNPSNQRPDETGWRRRDNPQEPLSAYYTKNLVRDGKLWVNATEYAGDPLIILFRAQVNDNNPTNFYIDNVQILYCKES